MYLDTHFHTMYSNLCCKYNLKFSRINSKLIFLSTKNLIKMKDNREFDVVIWGATGFTGKLVAAYMMKKYGANKKVKWAMAGRNALKLEEVQKELGADKVPLLIADSNKIDTLERMVQRTKVVCTTVGPYAKYGSSLVEMCVKHSTDYCDLAGEVQWMRKMIDQHQTEAEASGARIVHTCGFDSIPSDMGVYFLQKKSKELTGEYADDIKLLVKAMKGKMSGGTYASLSNVLAEAEKDKSLYKVLTNPFALNPKGERKGKGEKDLQKTVYDKDAKTWVAPLIMAGINTRVVRRSNAWLNYPYGKNFKYNEAMMTGDGLKGRAVGTMILMGTGLMMTAKPDTFLRNMLNRFLPKPGEGPSPKEQEEGFYKLILIGKQAGEIVIKGSVTGDRDPGYGSTSKMLAECAVCLAMDKKKTPEVAGFLTPSVAFGDVLLERLEKNAGLKFKIYEK